MLEEKIIELRILFVFEATTYYFLIANSCQFAKVNQRSS